MAYTEKISLRVNVDKIDKDALFKGEKGTYLNLTIVPTPTNQYDDYMITQYRGKGEENVILGNGRDLVFNDSNSKETQPMKLAESSTDGLPF